MAAAMSADVPSTSLELITVPSALELLGRRR